MTVLFPKELLQQCLSYEDQEDPGTLLQLILSVLEENLLLNLMEESDNEIPIPQWQSHLMNQFQKDGLPLSNCSSLPETMYQLMRLGKTRPTQIQNSIPLEESPNPETTAAVDAWYLGLKLMALVLQHPKMTAFEVHSVAVQSIMGADTNSSSSMEVFWTLLLLLCCWSLEECQDQIMQAQAKENTTKIRYKRIKSLLLETIQMYQRQAFKTEEETTTNSNLLCIDPLWLDFIRPIGQSLWESLPETVRPSECLFWQAVTIGMDSRLVVLHPSQEEQRITRPSILWQANLDRALGHPWRVASFNNTNMISPPQRRQESLDWWTLERSSEQPPEDDDDDESPPDDYEALDTSWNQLGVALFAARVWADRPCVYQPWYQWRLWFPHVANLMNPELHPAAGNRDPGAWVVRGISLLQDLLPAASPRSLCLSTSFSINNRAQQEELPTTKKNQTTHHRRRPPDHPVGAFQLLLNVIAASAAAAAAHDDDDDNTNTPLPSTMELAQLCKDLLGKYTATSQVEIILDHLLPNCPHAGLRPKLLDLLRPLVAQWNQTDNNNQDNNNPASWRLQQELQGILQELGGYNFRDNSPQKGRLQNVDELMDQVEYFVSACALLQLMGKGGNSSALQLKHATNRKPITLQEFGILLSAQLVEWNSVTTPEQQQQVPDQFFRLNLLEMSIQQLLQ